MRGRSQPLQQAGFREAVSCCSQGGWRARSPIPYRPLSFPIISLVNAGASLQSSPRLPFDFRVNFPFFVGASC